MDEREQHGIQRARASYGTYVTSLDYDELQSLARLLEKLMESPGWAHFMELLDRRYQMLLNDFVYQEGVEHARYLRNTGMASGIEQARWAAQAIVLRASEMREEAAARQAEETEEETVG